jgi:predicted PurR-regulated permease PerM
MPDPQTAPPPPPPPPPRGVTPARGPNATSLDLLQGAILIVAVLYVASDLLIPLVFSVLLSFVLAPLVRALRRVRLPRLPAVLLTALLACAVVLGAAVLIGQQVSSLAQNLPTYQSTISRKLEGLQASGGLIDRVNAALSELQHTIRPPTPAAGGGDGATSTAPAAQDRGAAAEAPSRPIPVEVHQPPPTPFETMENVLGPLLEPLATTGIVLVLVIFILLYQADLRDRVIRLAGAQDLHRTMAAMDDAAYRLSRYFLAQVAMNTAYGLVMTAALWVIGLPNPLLWGFIAGLMRFVPFIGTFIAVVFPVLLALAVDPGWATLAWVGLLYAVGEGMMGQVVEPLVFGQSTGLSPIAVIAAATFWTWLWGPLGLLLATPLTVCVVVLGRHVDRLEFLEVALGDRPALEPEEVFYQRALAGDTDSLAEQAEQCLGEKPLAAYLDAVAVPALRLAQVDAARSRIAPERLDTLRQSVLGLLEVLEDAENPAPGAEDDVPPPAAPPAEWRAPGAVLCLAGRGPFDALLAAMLGQALLHRGFGVRVGGFLYMSRVYSIQSWPSRLPF